MARLLSECSKEEQSEIRKLERRKKQLQMIIDLGYLTKEGEAFFKKDLDDEIVRIERKYRNGKKGSSKKKD